MISQIKSPRWHVQIEDEPTSAEDVARLLLKLRKVDEESTFFNPPEPSQLSVAEVGIDPEALDRAIARIMTSKRKNEKVIVFGDYDADGICATAIVWQSLHGLGISALPFIPEREQHGYGLSDPALDAILAAGKPDLIITVDNGIVAHQPLARLKKLGIDVIVTDHHQPDSTLPPAFALIHTTQLCGASVAWMLARELCVANKTTLEKTTGNDQLDLAGLATIADLVQLQGSNRSFAAHGLVSLRTTIRPGLLALFTQASLDQSTLTEGTVGYSVAPRINAMGRLRHGLDALRLLCTSSTRKAAALAQELEITNIQRRTATDEAVNIARKQVSSQTAEHLLVAVSDQFAEGVIGLVAGRLVEEFHKPVIVFATGGSVAKGSARSVAGVNITELLRELSEKMLSVGGHPLAAGCSVALENLPEVIKNLQQKAQELVRDDQLEPQLSIEMKLPLELLSTKTFQLLEQARPFGMGNRTPLFLIETAAVGQASIFGREGTHLRFELQIRGNERLKVVGWKQAELLSDLNKISAAKPLQAVVKFIASDYTKQGFELQLVAMAI